MASKKDIGRALMLRGTLFVHLDPRNESVMVPKWLKNQPQLVLQVGLDMPVPIPDLRVDDQGVSGTLSFNRARFFCNVPWEAVFALVGDDGKGMVWPEDMPSEIAAEVEREARRRGRDPDEQWVRRRRGDDSETRLQAVPEPSVSQLEESPHEDEDAPAPPEPAGDAEVQTLPTDRKARRNPSDRPPSKRQGKRELPPYLRVVK